MKLLILAVLLQAGVAAAQTPGFEVASIKPNKSGDLNWTWHFTPGGRFTGENIPVKGVILAAYKLKESELSGSPGWTDSERYDISAKAAGNPSQDELMIMLQGLLADRFSLRFHRAEKEMPVFALERAKSGIKISETSAGSCVVPRSDLKPKAPAEATREKVKFCGLYSVRSGQLDGTGIDMARFADALSGQLDRPVIDKTGLSGIFDIRFSWNPRGDEVDTNGDPTAPSIFTAIEEQLGLRLQSSKGLVNVLVVDHIERSTEN